MGLATSLPCVRPLYTVKHRDASGNWHAANGLDFDRAFKAIHSHDKHRLPHSLQLWGYSVNGQQYSMANIASGQAPAAVLESIGADMEMTLSGAFDRH